MKNLLIGLVALSSISAFAETKISEFEKGYAVGRKSCEIPTEHWHCKNPELKYRANARDQILGEGSLTFRGGSRADAISHFPSYVIGWVVDQEKEFLCTKL